ncbi:MAG: hypothetical protein LUE27_04215 [Clostridia bacterium]|nr:hypothetical protein [Clostridia bacterium]
MAISYNKKRIIRNAAVAVLCCVAVGCTCLASACSEEETVTYPKGEDTQTMKNGDFEYFSIPDDAVYLIKTPDSWTLNGDSSTAMSGIISTSTGLEDQGWNALAADTLKAALDYNNELDSDDDDYEDEYIDYNGMTSSDILYKDNYAATLDTDDLADSYVSSFNNEADARSAYEAYFGITKVDDATGTLNGETVYYNEDDGDYYFESTYKNPVRMELIENPGTHYDIKTDTDGSQYIMVDDEKQILYTDDTTGDLFYINDDSYAAQAAEGSLDANDVSQDFRTYISNILMIHNAESTDNGISQYYSSSTTITIAANTAAEMSVWVKTSDLKFDKGYDQNQDEDRGAYIEVVQTVNGTTIDSTKIAAINTEKILAQDNNTVEDSNGWIQYTVYINGCDFADSTVTINLGLGGDGTTDAVAGYAFFDDVEITQYVSLDSTGCTYEDFLANGGSLDKSTCNLTTDADDKIFYADYSYRDDDARNSQDTHYYIDLASETAAGGESYSGITLSSGNVSAGLTEEEVKTKTYVSSEDDDAKYNQVTKKGQTEGAQLPSTMTDSRITAYDLIGTYSYSYTFTTASFSTDNSRYDYSNILNDALEGVGSLPKAAGSDTNMLLLLSAYGAAYTATIADNAFVLDPDEYVIVSFWVKTSDMNGKTAATLKIYDADDEDSSSSYAFETTDVTTDVGDDEDIFNGWVQCFFFVHNDTDETKTFNIDFSFGNTTIDSTTNNSYYYGWAILANMQILKTNEDINALASSGSYSTSFEITDTEDDLSGDVFDDADTRSDITAGIANTSSYNGVNGSSSTVVADADSNPDLDAYNSNSYAGLINKDYFEDYDEDLQLKILSSFDSSVTSITDALAQWEDVFGDLTYQPLIIVNNLREYAVSAEATDKTYTEYYVAAEADYEGEVFLSTTGKKLRKVTEDDEYDEDTTYYSLKNICNYGFVSSTSTFSSSGYTTISLKVMVSGDATAYIYLIDPDTNDILGYETPEYTFYYDDDGSVLDAEYDTTWTDKEHRTHIIYSMRDDGLYDNYKDTEDDGVYANIYNYDKVFKNIDFEDDTFYEKDENGNVVKVIYDDLEDGTLYYADESCTVLQDHYLVATDGTRIFEWSAEDEAYYYLVDEEYTYYDDDDEEVTAYRQVRAREDQDDEDSPYIVVQGFDEQYTRSYDPISQEDTPYSFVIGNTNGQWVTVNFIVHTGNLSKSYRVELWSGERGTSGVADDNTWSEGAIAFDYSAYSITDDNYDSLLSEYETSITDQYRNLLLDVTSTDDTGATTYPLVAALPSFSQNIEFYENYLDALIAKDTDALADLLGVTADKASELVNAASGKITQDDINAIKDGNDYTALYYTYSFYDSTSYVPWNAETAADGETGYDYSASDYTEALAYFTYNKYGYKDADGNPMVSEYNVFADYSVVDKEIEIGTVTIEEEEEEETETSYSVWLLVTSIILTVVLIVTLVAILIREIVRNVRRKKGYKAKEKNMYRKRERYIRRLHLAPTEDEGQNPGSAT